MPYQSKIILAFIGLTLLAMVSYIGVHYIAPGWQTIEQTVGGALGSISARPADDASPNGVTVMAGESVTVNGTDVTMTNESVAARDLSQPFDALYVVTLRAERGNQTATLQLTRSRPAGYVDQPSLVWSGYRFTLVKADPLGVQSAVVQVQPQA